MKSNKVLSGRRLGALMAILCCAILGPADGAAPAANGAAANAFVNAVRLSAPSEAAIPKSVLLQLSGAVCDLLTRGKSVHYVIGVLSMPSGGRSFPHQFVSAIVVDSTSYICPKFAPEVEKWAGIPPIPSTASLGTPADPPLAIVLPSDTKRCVTATNNANYLPEGMAGVVDGVACVLPQLGSKSYLYAYLMDDAPDYRSSLNAINTFSAINTDSSLGCPTVTPGHTGISTWSDNAFPAEAGQVVECNFVGRAGNVPQYVWTLPSKNIILKATGNPGSSMSHLNAWWLADANT